MLAALGVYWTICGLEVRARLRAARSTSTRWATSRRCSATAWPATAPMFIPGFGAFIRMKQHPATVQEEARIGLAGPIWGFAAAAALLPDLRRRRSSPFWAALTHTGAMINLFNLMPVWQLDGGHAFKALNRTERWIATGVAGAHAVHDRRGAAGADRDPRRRAGVPAGAERRGRPRPRWSSSPGWSSPSALLMKMPVPGAAMTTPPDIHYKRSRFSTRLPWDRLYTASHFWVLEAEPGRWRVGLTKFAARMLGDVVDLEFEVAGRRRRRGRRDHRLARGVQGPDRALRRPAGHVPAAPTRRWRRRSTSSTPTATAPAGSTRSRAPPTPARSTPAATPPCWTPPSTRCATICEVVGRSSGRLSRARFAGRASRARSEQGKSRAARGA